ncbi:MAG: SDR family NAD(P)-dependent oxidoreductase [Pyrinomonadaceae bacterium]
MKKLENKVAIVTGASKGIGASIAKKLGSEGATVVVNYATDKKGAEAVVSTIRAAGGKATAIQANVVDRNQVKLLFDKALQEYNRLDLLVNNAGVAEFRPLNEIDEEHFDLLFNLNVKGLLFASQEAARAFGDKGGSIINIGSLITRKSTQGLAVYSATKAAVETITKILAVELAPRKILVNAVLPGATETERAKTILDEATRNHMISVTPLGRFAQPDDIANVVALIASDEAAWMTGELVGAGGGMGL